MAAFAAAAGAAPAPWAALSSAPSSPHQQQQQHHLPCKLRGAWRRKTLAGHRLFLSYYLGQPEGVVASSAAEAEAADDGDGGVREVDDEEEEGIAPAATDGGGGGGTGMSRASRRRRRKQDKGPRRGLPPEEAPPRLRPGTAASAAGAADAGRGADRQHPLARAWQLERARPKSRTAGGGGGARRGASSFGEFVRALARPLPVSFRLRLGMDPGEEGEMRAELDPLLRGGAVRAAGRGGRGGGSGDPGRAYQAAPGSAAGSADPREAASRGDLRRACPDLKAFLDRWGGRGGLARQEVGSMLPVWLLQEAAAAAFSPPLRPARCLGGAAGGGRGGPEPDPTSEVPVRRRRVLDLCASPGSKAMQAAELLLLQQQRTGGRGGGGILRANDVSADRLRCLRDAVERSGIRGIGSVLRYSRLDAAAFPVPPSDAKRYDAVICDVPCSGDGTSRKDPRLLPGWTPNIANALHATQVAILSRALLLVRRGGVVAYSTCSLNPVEGEAVVAAALAAAASRQAAASPPPAGSASDKKPRRPRWELLELPALQGVALRPGVTSWKVADYVGGAAGGVRGGGDDLDDDDEAPLLRWHATPGDARAAGMEHAAPTLWPPPAAPSSSPLSPSSSEERRQLARCGRLWPQDQDTGGFFVALVRRVS
jgi:16S rRNA C967 or C1407 C5-methylase (RsmB/RsmF family)